MTLDNDTRGWIMTAMSGVGKTLLLRTGTLTEASAACMFGALIICVDLLIRQIPNDTCRYFKIQDSNAFLSSSLSLSFGVMVCLLRILYVSNITNGG